MGASIQLLLVSCMYNFLPEENSVSTRLLENLNVVYKKLNQSKDRFYFILILNEIRKSIGQGKCFRKNFELCYTALDCKDRKYNEAEELLWVIIYKVLQQNSIFCPFEKLIFHAA